MSDFAAAACRAGIDADTDLDTGVIVVAAMVMLHGDVSHARQLMRLAGPVRCPQCEHTAPLTSQLIDFQSAD